jgi:uncharacterized protein
MVAAAPAHMRPIALSERIETIDIVRGAALFGILASNMRAFNSPLAAYIDHSLMWQGAADRAAQAAVDVFISLKFITIFSFLFGMGFAVMMERADARGLAKRGFYLRRLMVLLLLGLLHAAFFWYGDILAPYALMGFILYLFRRSSPRKILIWASILYLWPLIVSGLMTTVAAAGIPMKGFDISDPDKLAAAIGAYSSGPYSAIFAERMKENAFMAFGLLFFYPRYLGMFLLGLLVWRKGIPAGLAANAALLRRCRNWGLALGLPLNLAGVALNEIYHPDPFGYSPILFLINTLTSIGVPLLSLFYVCSLALLAQNPVWLDRLRPFGAVGRTALSNYLLQTLICTTLYYSYGFALYGKVGPLLGLVPTFAIYATLLWLSQWWVLRFAIGPMEWIWRTLTYGERQPFRIAQPQP